MSDGLFDVPDDAYVIPPPAEDLSNTERRHRLIATRIANGEHPLGRPVMLHAEASRDPDDRETGLRCGTCKFRVLVHYHDKAYPKCWFGDSHPRESHSASSDIRKWWPACLQYEAAE